ncbi:YdiU family protein [Pseudoalteromonas rubra]|uniref:Protein nucleotidyltransferase YdiU n=1 Tax=Pseudoalteromonas rubra TaxID=43658 RepID=A0A5S3WPA2_9GAMM|nr:YdiU family protein [Pseudoalteromonas rubra]TMP29990.1 YdiU family protein [Pseudoalteromonas rubra]TMP32218.1 YdiU family protein [Pseudoalteromonas rubra]
MSDFFSRYTELGEVYLVPQRPQQFEHAQLLLTNSDLITELGMDVDQQQLRDYLAGMSRVENIKPVAMAYCGHQFGHFNPQLGDGRAHLIASFATARGHTYDMHLKGSGATVFSRGGDGLCALGPAVREYIMSHAMRALGVPTTQCLAVLSTNQQVMRQEREPGAVVCRIARSHIRVGTFQLMAMNKDVDAMQQLVELCIADQFDDISSSGEQRVLDFFERVCLRQCALILKWMQVGFIHGVMNTDNTLINGETIDYGPCAMMESFSFDAVFSSIDRQGRYAFGQQPNIASWNCGRLAESLMLLMDDKDAALERFSGILSQFAEEFNEGYQQMWSNKLGLLSWQESDQTLLSELLSLMQQNKLDYTNTFAALTNSLQPTPLPGYEIPEALADWTRKWRRRVGDNNLSAAHAIMQSVNPAIIPRNGMVEHFIDEFNLAKHSDEFTQWLHALKTPYLYQVYPAQWLATMSNEQTYQTFCGT